MLKKRQYRSNNVEAIDPNLDNLGRRDFLFRFGRGAGSVALSQMLFQDGLLASAESSKDPLIPKISACGSVAIKFCQWLVPKMELMYTNGEAVFDSEYDKPYKK